MRGRLPPFDDAAAAGVLMERLPRAERTVALHRERGDRTAAVVGDHDRPAARRDLDEACPGSAGRLLVDPPQRAVLVDAPRDDAARLHRLRRPLLRGLLRGLLPGLLRRPLRGLVPGRKLAHLAHAVEQPASGMDGDERRLVDRSGQSRWPEGAALRVELGDIDPFRRAVGVGSDVDKRSGGSGHCGPPGGSRKCKNCSQKSTAGRQKRRQHVRHSSSVTAGRGRRKRLASRHGPASLPYASQTAKERFRKIAWAGHRRPALSA